MSDNTETLYKKYTNLMNYPYYNSDFVRGASDKMNYEARNLLDANDPNIKAKLAGYASLIPLSYGLYKAGEELDDTGRAMLGAGTTLATRFAPNPESERIYAKRGEEPTEDSWMYKAGKEAVPLSMAYGIGQAFADKNALSAMPYFIAPVLAGMTHPSFNPFGSNEYLDKQE